MNRTFVEVPLFTKRWREIGLGTEELKNLPSEEKNVLKKLVKQLKEEAARRRNLS